MAQLYVGGTLPNAVLYPAEAGAPAEPGYMDIEYHLDDIDEMSVGRHMERLDGDKWVEIEP